MGTAVDEAGNVYVADVDNNCIRKITPDWAVTTLAGGSKGFLDEVGDAAKFNQPNGVAVDRYGNVYVADAGNNRIRKISPAGVVTTVAGSTAGFADTTGVLAKFNQPKGIAVDAAGVIYVSDAVNNRIRKISIPVLKPFTTTQGRPSSTQSVTVSGLFLRANATLSSPPAFEISLSPNTGYKSVLTISPIGREITSSLIYIRVKASALAGTYNGNVTISSSGSATQKMPVKGTVMASDADNLIGHNKLNIFPNPSKGAFTIQLKDVEETELKLKIYDENGKIVMYKNVKQVGKIQGIPVQLANPSSGVYFIQITGTRNVFASKVIVE
ncbi:T9SS type A sorting domain-containing protein [Danxiaibacter flavus]|uniref:T9SS type A sorting domain-containing protein n=1 Tax=Danxiaibacter flavus TaxID=3049108 RepID=A0ABV3ZDK8_9BACT|nr:T9SS type A sorting domain-containing protein [Chitinophagaceae bacterium DXS]